MDQGKELPRSGDTYTTFPRRGHLASYYGWQLNHRAIGPKEKEGDRGS